MLQKITHSIRDALRIDKAFNAAAHGAHSEALGVIDSLGERAKRLYDVRLLKGALLCQVGMHDQAIDELTAAVKSVKLSKKLSKAEANYLTAYAMQYWERSAEEVGLRHISKEMVDLLSVEDPIEVPRVAAHLRRKFPLTARFVGVEVHK
jgi:hypothetical protein